MRRIESTQKNKASIWVDDENVLNWGDFKTLNTTAGEISYEVKVPSMVCYNDLNGQPNQDDGWVENIEQIEKNYVL